MGIAGIEPSSVENIQQDRYISKGKKEFSTMEKMIFLKNVSIFSTLPIENLFKIASSMKTKYYKDGEVVFHENTTGDTFYVVFSGDVEIFKKTENNHDLSLAVFGKEQYLGEMSIVE